MSKRPSLQDLFPGGTEEDIGQIAEVLHGYCSVVWRIYERLERDHPEVIDGLMERGTMKAKVDSSKKN